MPEDGRSQRETVFCLSGGPFGRPVLERRVRLMVPPPEGVAQTEAVRYTRARARLKDCKLSTRYEVTEKPLIYSARCSEQQLDIVPSQTHFD